MGFGVTTRFWAWASVFGIDWYGVESGIDYYPTHTVRWFEPAPLADKCAKSHEQDNGFLNESDYLSPKDRKRVDLFTLFALAAAEEALNPSELATNNEWKDHKQTATINRNRYPVDYKPSANAQSVCNQSRSGSFITLSTVPAFSLPPRAGNGIDANMVFKGPIGTHGDRVCCGRKQAIGDCWWRSVAYGWGESLPWPGGTEALISIHCPSGRIWCFWKRFYS